MTAYEPGTVAVATVRGVPNVRIFRSQGDWISGDTVEGAFWVSDDKVTDIRPLVVLDLSRWFPEYVAKFPDWLRSKEADSPSGSILCYLADEIEAHTKPPRIPEPGLWGVVEATLRSDEKRARLRYVRTAPAVWLCVGGAQRTWDELLDPVLVRDGIEDGAR